MIEGKQWAIIYSLFIDKFVNCLPSISSEMTNYCIFLLEYRPEFLCRSTCFPRCMTSLTNFAFKAICQELMVKGIVVDVACVMQKSRSTDSNICCFMLNSVSTRTLKQYKCLNYYKVDYQPEYRHVTADLKNRPGRWCIRSNEKSTRKHFTHQFVGHQRNNRKRTFIF